MTTFLPANSAAGSTSAPPSAVACLMVTDGIFWPLVIMALPYHRASFRLDSHVHADRGRRTPSPGGGWAEAHSGPPSVRRRPSARGRQASAERRQLGGVGASLVGRRGRG